MNETATPTETGFRRALDSRGHKVKGIWVRNGRHYAQMTIPGKKGPRRVPLTDDQDNPIETVPQAIKARAKLLADRDKGTSPSPRITPEFSAYVLHYLKWLDSTQAKSVLTIKKERSALTGWADFLTTTRLNQITRVLINKYVAQRTDPEDEDGVGPRTANLDVTAMANILRFAKTEGWLRSPLVTDDWTALKYTPPVRPLLKPEDIETICKKALGNEPKYENGQFLADLIRLLAYSGGRRQGALSAKWDQVDWNNRQITFFSKFDKRSIVDFNDPLEAHLKDMWARRDVTKPWIFPSPRKQKKGLGFLANPQKVLDAVTEAAGFPGFKLHDLRHYFISFCVMSGVDTMTICAWVGHADGGKLIGEVYGHLDPKHKRESAGKVRFSLNQPPTEAAVPSTGSNLDSLSAAELLAALQKKLAGPPEQSALPIQATATHSQKPESAPRPDEPNEALGSVANGLLEISTVA